MAKKKPAKRTPRKSVKKKATTKTGINAKQEQFAQLVAAGYSYNDAYGEIGFKRHYGNSSQYARHPAVESRIQELRIQIAEKAGVSNAFFLEKTIALLNKAEAKGDLQAAKGFLVVLGKACGFFRETVQHNHTGAAQVVIALPDNGRDPVEPGRVEDKS